MSGFKKEEPLYRDKEWLDYQLNVLKKNQRQVAKECGVGKSTISYWSDEHNRKRQKEYREENKHKIKEYQESYYKENREKIKEQKEKNKYKVKEYRKNIKIQVLNVLGGCKCSLCDVTNVDFLSIDHIDKTGHLDRKDGLYSISLYSAILNKIYPQEKLSNLRVLCYNHNLGRTKEYLDFPPTLQTRQQRRQTKFWKMAFDFFGPCPCGISELKFLTISHIHNDGAEQRKNGEKTGIRLLERFYQQGWPETLKEDYRLECANCNLSKKYVV